MLRTKRYIAYILLLLLAACSKPATPAATVPVQVQVKEVKKSGLVTYSPIKIK